MMWVKTDYEHFGLCLSIWNTSFGILLLEQAEKTDTRAIWGTWKGLAGHI